MLKLNSYYIKYGKISIGDTMKNEEFYYKLLNIKQNNNPLNTIKNIIKKNVKETNTDNLEGLCKYFANNIKIDLQENNISVKKFDIKDFINIDYSHEFLIAFYFDQEMKYILIDPTYKQFLKTENKKLISFNNWPSEVLINLDGEELLNNLLTNHYSFITKKDLILYLKSFDNYVNDINFEEIIKK